MYFPDMSFYQYDCYLGPDNPIPIPDVRNIGWLERGYEYTQGNVDNMAIGKLKHLLTKRECLVVYRGYHYCDLCKTDEDVTDSPHDFRLDESHPRSAAVLWIAANRGYFATPSLIVHYIQGHGYCPPSEFVDAVHSFEPDSEWDADSISEAQCNQARKAYR